jgi:hypothetical protein
MGDQVLRVAAWLREMPLTLLMDLDSTILGMPDVQDVTVNEFMQLLSNEADRRVENGWEG